MPDYRILPEPPAPPVDRTTPAMRDAFHLLLHSMTAEERAYVLCWFCNVCREYIPPGKSCEYAAREDHRA